MEKRSRSTRQRLDRDQVLLTIRTPYDDLSCRLNKGGGRRDTSHAFVADAGSSGKDGNRNTPRGATSRGIQGRGGRGDRCQGGNGRENDYKSDDTKDGNRKVDSSPASVECKRCGDDGHKPVRCPGQRCGVCGGRGHAAEICANIVSVLACQAPADDKILSGEEEEAFICETLDRMISTPVPSEGERGGDYCELDS